MLKSLDDVVERLKSIKGRKSDLSVELKKIEDELLSETERLATHNLPYTEPENLRREVLGKEKELLAKAFHPEAEALKEEALKEEALKEEALKERALKEEELKAEESKVETLKEELLKEETPKAKVPKASAPKTAKPGTPKVEKPADKPAPVTLSVKSTVETVESIKPKVEKSKTTEPETK